MNFLREKRTLRLHYDMHVTPEYEQVSVQYEDFNELTHMCNCLLLEGMSGVHLDSLCWLS